VFVHRTRLPHVLGPSCYHTDEHHARELASVFRPRWHCVATLDELVREGDYVAPSLWGTPLLVRRGRDGVRAFRNVCVHRYAKLTRAKAGNLPTLRCPYHGFRYDDGGVLEHVPDGASFASPPGEPDVLGRVGLSAVAMETVGRLVFVCLAPDPPPLRRALDARTWSLASELFTDAFELVFARRIEHRCNWKIPLENVLETYHVPELHRSALARHPRLLRVFGAASGADTTEHELSNAFTEYRDLMGADALPYRALVRALVGRAPCRYRHHHAFPSLIVAGTPILSFLQVITPTGPTTSESLVCLYLHRGTSPSLPTRALRHVARSSARWFLDTVLAEDGAVYEAVQEGVRGTERRGMLGAREERVWAFQRWLDAAVTAP
jgi:choline monooxygenase